MSALWTLVDAAVADALSAHPDYLTPKGQEAFRKIIVRKVTGALRDSMSLPKPSTEPVQEQQQQPAQPAGVECWSREWWAVLLHKINTRQSTAWMLSYARTDRPKGTLFAVAPQQWPSAEFMASLSNYPSDGTVMAAWRPWFEYHGVRLPEWRSRVWVFLPGTDPPDFHI